MSINNDKTESRKDDTENGVVKKSIRLLLVRHAESMNNQVYTDARHLFNVGTPEYNDEDWKNYIRTHRKADPGLSDRGHVQAQILGDHLNQHLLHHASHPVNFVVSPMKRTILTILPTLSKLETREGENTLRKSNVVINGFYFESEGCHLRGKPESGMNPSEISELLEGQADVKNPQFEGFDMEDSSKGWYADGTGPETREQSESRSAKFYLWLCDFLDAQISSNDYDVFDAGAPHPDDNHKNNDGSPRIRQRRTCVLVGHGDFMGLLLKRIVAGFGHAVETLGVPHRSAFVHFNTGITEVEYFGNGRFLVMGTNLTPHLDNPENISLKTGGSLKDGWSFIIPAETNFSDEEVTIHFSDELEDHVREQTDAMKNLYLKRPSSNAINNNTATTGAPATPSMGRRRVSSSALRNLVLSGRGSEVEEASTSPNSESLSVSNLTFDYTTGNGSSDAAADKTFVIRRGLQVIGCASFNEQNMSLTDVVVRQSCRRQGVGTALVNSVRTHLKGNLQDASSGTYLTAKPMSKDSLAFFEHIGFAQESALAATPVGEAIALMQCKL